MAEKIVQTAGRNQLGEFAPMFAHLNDDVLFGEVWNEEAIDVKTKCIITVVSLMASGITDSSLTYHLQNAKAHGVTKEEIAAIITHATMYVGWPKGWAVFRLAKEVWNEEALALTDKEKYQNTIFFPIGEPNPYGQFFVGESYLAPVSTEQVPIFNVTFEPGCRNNWHVHHAKKAGGQMLICVGGRGYYQEWGKEAVEMTPGTVINIPAEVKHWHGAAPDSWFSHLAIEIAGEEASNEWLEAVSEEDYNKLKEIDLWGSLWTVVDYSTTVHKLPQRSRSNDPKRRNSIVMKRMVSIIAVTMLTIALTACGGSSQAATTGTQAAENSAPAVAEEQKETAEAAEQTEAQTEEAQEAVQETAAEPASEASAAAHSDVLVAYFSATGTTKGVAERIASVTGGDLYEILAAQPYTEADLNYNDNSSRSTSEQNDKSVRPEIGSDDISLEGYTTVYLGFPIWWGEEPRILDTFVEKYNFDGITVIPFCTSASSGIGRSGSNMEELAGSGTWLQGERFSGSVSEDELKSWIEGLK